MLDEKFADLDSTLSKEEIEHLKQSLDSLYVKFEELQQENAITKDELSKIKTALEELKIDTEKFPKKAWYRAAGNNIFKFTSKLMSSPVGQKIIEEGTRKLLEPPSQ